MRSEKSAGADCQREKPGSTMDEREYLPLSWLSQADYCLRRAALLLNERIWEESSDTAKGRAEHERVHTQRIEKRGGFVKLYEYTVHSDEMGLLGKCDCIEVSCDENGCTIPAVPFPVKLYPVEYKHGSMRKENEYEIQLCAQAMCLEEMFQTSILEGALFYISSHRRLPVQLTEELRTKTRRTAFALRNIRESLSVPNANYSEKCKRCSLQEYCMPRTKASARAYCNALEAEAKEGALREELP